MRDTRTMPDPGRRFARQRTPSLSLRRGFRANALDLS
jgi:hypothetical protein